MVSASPVPEGGAAVPTGADNGAGGWKLPSRCASHPSRLVHDTCPTCRRSRCAADATLGSRCRWCRRVPLPPGVRLQATVATGLAGLAVALAGGDIATQYVGVSDFSVGVPAAVGVVAGLAAGAAQRRLGGLAARVSAVAAGLLSALLGTALGFRLVPGGQVLHPAGLVVEPYLAAAVAAVLAALLVPVSPRRAPRCSTAPAGLRSTSAR